MRISRREVMGGALALAGVSACGGVAAADSFNLDFDERLFVGMVGVLPHGYVSQKPSTLLLIGDNPRDRIMIWAPLGGFPPEDLLPYGTRVWAAEKRGDFPKLYRRTRVLRTAAADSPEAMAARAASLAAAERSSVWMECRIARDGGGEVSVRLTSDNRLLIGEPKNLSSRSNPLLMAFAGMGGSGKAVAVRGGRIWDGTIQVFETKVLG